MHTCGAKSTLPNHRDGTCKRSAGTPVSSGSVRGCCAANLRQRLFKPIQPLPSVRPTSKGLAAGLLGRLPHSRMNKHSASRLVIPRSQCPQCTGAEARQFNLYGRQARYSSRVRAPARLGRSTVGPWCRVLAGPAFGSSSSRDPDRTTRTPAASTRKLMADAPEQTIGLDHAVGSWRHRSNISDGHKE